MQNTILETRGTITRFFYPHCLPEHDLQRVRPHPSPHPGVPGARLAALRGGALHRLQEGLRRPALEFIRPGPEVDQVPAVPGALRLRQRQLHQGPGDPGEGPLQDGHH